MKIRAISALAGHWHSHGARGVLSALRGKIFWHCRYVRLRVDLDAWDDPGDPEGPLVVQRGVLEDLVRFREATPGLPVQFYEDRVHGAREFYLGLYDGDVAHISWAYGHQDRTPQVALRPGEVELNGAYTRKPYRGKGLLPAVERGMMRDLKRQGVKTVYTHVGVDNVASLRGVAKAGFRPVGILTWRWILGVSWRRYEPGVVAAVPPPDDRGLARGPLSVRT